MKYLLLFITLNLFSLTTLHAQIGITGVVTDENNSPLPGAVVSIKNTYTNAITNEKGSFQLSVKKKSEIELIVQFLGYEKANRVVPADRLERTIRIKMSPSPILSDEVIVSGTRATNDTPVAFQTITEEEIQVRNMSQDIPYLLDTSPSFVTTSDGGSGVGYTGFRIRGTDVNRINVTMDGVPLNDAESHRVYFVNLPDFASSLSSVQVQRGVGTSSNGSASFGATVNMQTKAITPEPFAEVASSYGSFNTNKNTLQVGSGVLNDHFGFEARISSINSDGYIDRASSDLFSYALSGGYMGEKDILKFNMFSGEEHTYQAWNGITPEQKEIDRKYNPAGQYTDAEGNVRFYDNQTDNYEQKHYQLFYSHAFDNSWTLNTTLHYTRGEGYYESMNDDELLSDYRMDNVIVDGVLQEESDIVDQKWLDNKFGGLTFSLLRTINNVDLTLGGAGNYYNGDHFGRVIWAEYIGNTPVDHEYYRGDGNKIDLSTYAKAIWTVGDNVNLFSDLQYRFIDYDISGTDDNLRDVTQSHNFSFLNPKLGVLYNIDDEQDIYLSYGMSNREPSRSNYTDADEGQEPQAETLHDFELGYNKQTTTMAFGVNLYYMYYRDQLVYTGEINNTGSSIQTNVDRSYRAGMEMSAAWQITPILKWEANATISRNMILDYEEYVDDWDTGEQVKIEYEKTDIAFSPNAIANSTFAVTPLPNLRINWISQFVSNQFLDNTGSAHRKLDSYWVNHLKLDYTLKQKWAENATFSLLVNNFLNTKYESNGWVYSYFYEAERKQMIGLYPQAGINAMAGINVRF